MKLSYRDFIDIAVGGTILGTGGGGSYETAELLAKKMLRGKSVRLVSRTAMRKAAKALVIAGMGLPEAMLKTPFTTEARNAFDAFAECEGGSIEYVLPIETSGFNFLTPMTVAASRSGVAVVDGDGAGRAIPQLSMTLFYDRGVPLAPLALADAGDRSVVIRGKENALSEKLAIASLESFGWSAGLACFPMTTRQIRGALVPGTISHAADVGRALREAAPGADPAAIVLGVTGGFELVHGTVDRFASETSGSYSFGVLEVVGRGPYQGRRARIKSMNENMVAWLGGRLAAVAPDRICFVRSDGRPITNADIKAGEELSVIVIEAQSDWRTPKTASLFENVLAKMGYEGTYVPASQLHSRTAA